MSNLMQVFKPTEDDTTDVTSDYDREASEHETAPALVSDLSGQTDPESLYIQLVLALCLQTSKIISQCSHISVINR